MREQFQLELWAECRTNRCKFCNLMLDKSLINGPLGKFSDPNMILKADQKVEIINRAIDYLPSIDWGKFDKLTIRGGEVFNDYDINYLKSFDLLLWNIIDLIKQGKIKKCYLVTGLKYRFKNSLLEHSLNYFQDFKKFILVGASWDLYNRFFNDDEQIWWENINIIKSMDISIHITTILTQYFINAYNANDKKVFQILDTFDDDQFDFIAAYGKTKLNLDNFFCKRNDFLKFWCGIIKHQKYKNIWERFLNQSYRRASHIYFAATDELQIRDLKNYTFAFEGESFGHLVCGHPDQYANYEDSNKCMLCDIFNLQKNGEYLCF